MALVTLVSIGLTTGALSIWLITCYYYYRKSNGSHIHTDGPPSSRENASRHAHLLVVLGSGGHTAEMLSMLARAPLDPNIFTHRTYVVSSGDSFSALKATEFEKDLLEQQLPLASPAVTTATSKGGPIPSPRTTRQKRRRQEKPPEERKPPDSPASKTLSEIPSSSYTIITVPRARRVHQSFLTAPVSTLHCLWACINVLRGTHPDRQPQKGYDISSPLPALTSTGLSPPTTPYPNIILTNGPATAVCVILAARILRAVASMSIFPLCNSFQQKPSQQSQSFPRPQERYLRTVFVESWARVTTLSLSGKIVLPLVDRFLVQWDGLAGRSSWLGGKTEFVGALVA
ncbi:glycosyl transferase [Histoplasma capsulatum var. duboisii H88]|uniref:UDP-N-acetylglucosamine transferase subunit ALG14 n=2 Tax=Ajellomyces capsulatus (strain H88) TaxID=544711 RepID=F0U5T6_AJEC8|nr:glycosyl transferase [Histoplasma capsulatum var. duboisii H88]